MRRRRIFLGIALAAGGLALAALLAYLFRRPLIYEPLRRAIERRVQARLGGTAHLAGVDGTLVHASHVEGGTLENILPLPPGSKIRFESLRMDYDLAGLARGERDWVRRIEVVRPTFEFDLTGRAARAPRPAGGAAAPPGAGWERKRPPIPEITVTGGTVILRLPGRPEAVVSGLEVRVLPRGDGALEARLKAASLPYEIFATADLAELPARRASASVRIDGAGALEASLRADWSGAGPPVLEGRARARALDLGPIASLLAGRPFPGGAPLSLEARADRGRVRVDAFSLGALGALIRASGRAAPGPRGGIDLVATLEAGLADLAPLAEVAGRPGRAAGALEVRADVCAALFSGEARGGAGLTIRARGLALAGRAVPLDEIALDAALGGGGTLEVASLEVRAAGAVLHASGAASLAERRVMGGRVSATIPEIAAFAAALSPALAGRLAGAADLAARVDAAPLAGQPTDVLGGLRGELVLSLRKARVATVRLPGLLASVDAPGDGTIYLRELAVAVRSELEAVRLSGRLTLRDGAARASIDSLSATVGGKRVSPPLLARAEIDAAGGVEAVVSIPRLEIEPLGAFIPGAPRLSGLLTVFATGGLHAGSRSASLRLTLDHPAGYGLSAERVDLLASLENERASLDRLLLDRGPGGAIAARGAVALATRQGELLLDLRSLDLSPAGRFIPEVREMRGRLGAQVVLAGPLDHPRVSGFADLRGGAVHFRELVGTFDGVRAHIEMDGDTARLESLTFRAGGGPGSARGEARFAGLRPVRFELDLQGRDLLLLSGADARLRAGIAVHAAGTPRAMKASGSAHVSDFRWYRDFGLFTRRPAAAAEVGAGSSFLRALALDLHVTTEPQVWVDNREALARAQAEFRVTGSAASPRLDGSASIVEGRARIYDRTFRIDRGVVSFLDGSIRRPWLDIAAVSRQSGIEIFVTVRGEARDPEIQLSSSPALPQADIVSLLTIGTTRAGAQEAGAGSLAYSAAGRYLLSQALERFRGRNRDIGILDRITIEADANRPGTTSSATAAAEASGPRFTVIYDVTDSWALQTERDRYGFYNFDVFYQWRFR